MSDARFINPIGMIGMVDTSLVDRLNDETKAKQSLQDDGDDSPKYTVAVETELFMGEEKQTLEGRYKALTNKANDNQIFAIVGDGYLVIQHDDVVDTIDEALDDLNMKPVSQINEMSEGGRIHGDMFFPDHYVDVTGRGDVINLRISFDNSYDTSTGVRMNFGAFHPTTQALLYIGERYSNFYHKHTRGLNKDEMTTDIKKGAEIFQDKISKMFQGMATTPVNFAQVKDFLDERADKKLKDDVPVKYLNFVNDSITSGTQTMWDLFITYSKVLGDKCDSIDARKKHSLTFLSMFVKASNENRI